MHTIISPVFYVYAIVVLLGGVFGYAKAKSMPSLVSGIVAAVLEVVAGILAPHHPRSGIGLGILVALALATVFALRLRSGANPMLVLTMCTISTVVFAIGLWVLIQASTFGHPTSS